MFYVCKSRKCLLVILCNGFNFKGGGTEEMQVAGHSPIFNPKLDGNRSLRKKQQVSKSSTMSAHKNICFSDELKLILEAQHREIDRANLVFMFADRASKTLRN